MKLAINIALSVAMLALCTWLVWPNASGARDLQTAFAQLNWTGLVPYLLGYVGLLAVTHFCRAWRWRHLLRPLGVELGGARLLAISSVGFMAILALPARLGEFVRPALIRRRGHISASQALGTVAVERIVDGLLISILVFAAVFALRGWQSPYWAYLALGIFIAATLFLLLAMRWPQATVNSAVACTLLPWVAPKFATFLRCKLLQVVAGFAVLGDTRNFRAFVLWSLCYWITSGLSLWLLARGFGLELPAVGAFATMGVIAVGITLPNSPGLVGQYHQFAMLGLGLYLEPAVVSGPGFAFVIVLHAVQVLWYMTVGALALLSKHVSLAEVVKLRQLDDHDRDEIVAPTGSV